MLCPVCKNEGVKFVNLNKDFIINNFEKDYQEIIPEDLGIIDYSMYRCSKCSLVYASPLKEGSSNFYNWLTKHQGYYATNRWEWDFIFSNFIKKYNIKSVLEVGCGTGIFLKKCQDIYGLEVVGLDTEKDSIDECKKGGIESYCETIEEYSSNQNRKFDLIVSFHCLEHVIDPKTFISSQVDLLKSGGRILVSTPYTTTPGEQWYETLNYPPHHMTQWNYNSYNELAKRLGLKIRLFMPHGNSFFHRVINSVQLMYKNKYDNKNYSKKKKIIILLFNCLINPIKIIKEILRHISREKITVSDFKGNEEIKRSQVVDYVVLVELFL